MEPSRTRIAVVLVDNQFQALTRRFLIKTAPNDIILNLKQKVKETRPSSLPASLSISKLVMWKSTGELVINRSTSTRMAEILGAIKVDDKNTIQRLEEDESVADLGLTPSETLLVQLPGTSRIPTIVGCVLMQV